jgi:hypothetical protein
MLGVCLIIPNPVESIGRSEAQSNRYEVLIYNLVGVIGTPGQSRTDMGMVSQGILSPLPATNSGTGAHGLVGRTLGI